MPVKPSNDRGRGRPRRDTPALTRELITETALALAGAEGFGALTMHRLARELGVTPRALYNHVADRQQVVDLVASRMLQQTPIPTFDHPDWREALRDAYAKARSSYRKHPRATLISLDETVTPTEIDPARILLAERMLEFLAGLGLTLPQALAVRGGFLLDVFAFALLIDYRYDRGDDPARRMIGQPVPEVWLRALPDVEARLSREATTLPAPTSDDMFDELVAMRIAMIEALLSTPARGVQ